MLRVYPLISPAAMLGPKMLAEDISVLPLGLPSHCQSTHLLQRSYSTNSRTFLIPDRLHATVRLCASFWPIKLQKSQRPLFGPFPEASQTNRITTTNAPIVANTPCTSSPSLCKPRFGVDVLGQGYRPGLPLV